MSESPYPQYGQAPPLDHSSPYSQPSAYGPPPGPGAPTNGLALGGFIVSVCAILFAWIPVVGFVGLVMGLVGAILAGLGVAKSRIVGTGKGLAVAGLILGVVSVVVSIGVNVLFFSTVDSAFRDGGRPAVSAPAGTRGEDGVEDGLGSKRSAPAPLGSTIKSGAWAVTVNSVTVVDKDAYDNLPAADKVLIVVNVSATYEGADEQGENPRVRLAYATVDGTSISEGDGSDYFTPEDRFDSSNKLYTGGTTSGNFIFEVPAATWQDGVLAVSMDFLAKDTFVAVK